MAVIKVQASMFSTIKTVGRALEKMKIGDEIHVSKGLYREDLNFIANISIIGANKHETVLEGIFKIPKDYHVVFRNMTIRPETQMVIEGHVTFYDVILEGQNATSALTVQNGYAILNNCTITDSKEFGISAFNESTLEITETMFSNNKKAHLYGEHSKVTLRHSTFQNGHHAVWLTEKCLGNCNSNTFQNQKGTQIVVQNESTLMDHSSNILSGKGNGICANRNSNIELTNTIIKNHSLPQIWVKENSSVKGINCDIQKGEESAIMIRDNSEAFLQHCYISNHSITNVQVMKDSRLHLENTQILNSNGMGVHIKENSIANFEKCTFSQNTLSQLFISQHSISSLKECTIQKGKQLGIFVEIDSNCTIVESKIQHHQNTAITISESELNLFECEVLHNAGNGILALQNATIHTDTCKFEHNNMPHIAGKDQTALTIINSNFNGGKSIYLLEQSHAHITNSTFTNADGIHVEITEETKLTLNKCKVFKGNSNALKATKNSTFNIYDSQISHHHMPQIVLNDSSLIFKNSELLDGEKNGFIIENYSEAFIQDSFISKHRYPQIWIDKHSTVELKTTQITDGQESDIYAQNNSSVYADQCIIRNDQFKFNVQAVNHSKIDLTHTIVENRIGEQFYIENNSFIKHKLDKEKND